MKKKRQIGALEGTAYGLACIAIAFVLGLIMMPNAWADLVPSLGILDMGWSCRYCPEVYGLLALILVQLGLIIYAGHRMQRLADGFKKLLYLCEECGDFKNGNTDSSIDEGEDIAYNMIQEAKKSSRIESYK